MEQPQASWDRPSRFKDRQRTSAPKSDRSLSGWDEAWRSFITQERVARNWTASTLANYEWVNGDRLRDFRKERGIAGPSEFTDALFYEFFGGLQATGLQDSTRIKMRNCLGVFLQWAKDRGLREQAAPRVKIRQPPEGVPDHLLPEEITQVLDVCRTGRDRFIIKFMIWTGLRVGELTAPQKGQESALTVDMLDLNTLQPCVRGVRSRKESQSARPTPIPLIDGLDQELRQYLRRRPASRYQAVFLTDRRFGGEYLPLTRSAVQSIVRRLKYDCDLAQLHPHTLRHTFGILMAEQMGIHWTQQVMRHSRSSTTDRYLRSREEIILAAAPKARIRLPKGTKKQ